jgi:hypothetical protein
MSAMEGKEEEEVNGKEREFRVSEAKRAEGDGRKKNKSARNGANDADKVT